ncbi:DUF3277 family protein [Acinetobacter sp. NIPH 1869]|jgi:hypothetical protein|uniref:phage protein n=1 Tax=Acinetobacter higginsii TaxID=70347 RepID=UPI001F4BC8F8|nr:phage protein [Acinetobacter higginsii]MCH7305627.1 DUF3277 family protein [Acinetobacter higginsii]
MAGQQLRAYSLSHHVVTVNGRTMENFGEGDDVIKVALRDDQITDKKGADGNIMPEVSANESAEVSLKFLYNAPENTYLEGLQKMFVEGFIHGVSVSIYDTRSGQGEVSTTGYIKRRADKSRGAKAADREWVIVVPKLAVTGIMR